MTRLSRRFSRSIALATGALLLTNACTSQAPQNDAQTAGGTLVIDKIFDMITADPARMFSISGNMILHAVYDSLLTFEGGNATDPVPALAESWSINDDATEYTFTIRAGVTFSDGTPLTAEDVVFSLNRVKNVQGNGSFQMDGLNVSSPDADTVVITSDTPNTAVPAILASATLGIVNKKVVTENGGSDATDAATSDTAEAFLNSTSAGSGPYILESFDSATEAILVKNPNYWGTAPVYDRVVLRHTTPEVQLSDIQSDTAQIVLDLGSDQTATLVGNDRLHLTQANSPTMFFLFSNANPEVSAITATDDFREAVRFGLDLDGVLELAGEGANIAYGIIPNTFLGAVGEEVGVARDTARASAAVERLGGNLNVTLEYGSDFGASGLVFGPFAERISAQLAEIGINVTLAPSPVPTALESYRGGTEEMGLWLWNPDYPDSADYLAFGPGATVGLRAGWTSDQHPELVALMEQVASETDTSVREGLYQQFQVLMNEAGVIIPLFQPAATVVSSEATGPVNYDPVYSLEIAAIGR